jgi:hypothetical protein
LEVKPTLLKFFLIPLYVLLVAQFLYIISDVHFLPVLHHYTDRLLLRHRSYYLLLVIAEVIFPVNGNEIETPFEVESFFGASLFEHNRPGVLVASE